MIKLAKKFDRLVGKTKKEIISKFGNNYVHSDNVFYYTLNRTWLTKGITLSIKFDVQERVEEIDIMENDRTILPYIFSFPNSYTQYRILENATRNNKDRVVG